MSAPGQVWGIADLCGELNPVRGKPSRGSIMVIPPLDRGGFFSAIGTRVTLAVGAQSGDNGGGLIHFSWPWEPWTLNYSFGWFKRPFLVHKSPLPTLVNNSNFSESHPWQSTGVMLMGSKTQLLHVETGLPVLQETADRPVSGSASVGFLSCDRPREEVDGKSARARWVEKLHTHMHTPQVFRGKKKQAHCVLDIVTLWNVNVVIPANLCKTHQYLNGSFFMFLQTIDTSYYGYG